MARLKSHIEALLQITMKTLRNMHKAFHCKPCSQENMSSKGLAQNGKLRNLGSIQYMLSILGLVSRYHIWVNQSNLVIANWRNWPSHNQLLGTLCWRMLTNGSGKHGAFEKETSELEIVNPCPALSWHRGFSEVLICTLSLLIRPVHLDRCLRLSYFCGFCH